MINTTDNNKDTSVRVNNNVPVPFSVNKTYSNDTPITNNKQLIINDTNTKQTKNILSFATHNVHGLNHVVKNKQIIETFKIMNADFIGLTETHHKQYH